MKYSSSNSIYVLYIYISFLSIIMNKSNYSVFIIQFILPT